MKSYFKEKTNRNPEYLSWIRSKPCLKCCAPAPSEAHHEALTGKGISCKGSDFETVPLCAECHRARHDIGRISFWGEHWLTNLAVQFVMYHNEFF